MEPVELVELAGWVENCALEPDLLTFAIGHPPLGQFTFCWLSRPVLSPSACKKSPGHGSEPLGSLLLGAWLWKWVFGN